MASVITRDDGALELSRVCHFARVSLARRYRNLLAEDDAETSQSRLQQAEEIEASFRRIRGAVNELRGNPDCLCSGASEMLSRLDALCMEMTCRVELVLRDDERRSSWMAAGQSLIREAFAAICDIERDGALQS